MIVRRNGPFPAGYSPIAQIDGENAGMLLDFGILVIERGQTWTGREPGKEHAYLLLDGELEFASGGATGRAARSCVLDEEPWAVHCSHDSQVTLRAVRRSELVVARVVNAARFPSVVYRPGEIRSELLGQGTMHGTATRTVRTIFDAATHETSGMVLGEVVNHPGKWSSYPPHSHPHPEIYHYRFSPAGGFGFGQAGEEIVRLQDRDTLLIPGGVPHPQTAAPGYAMFYVWAIPHLAGNRFGPDSRQFDPAHGWVMHPQAQIWPEGRK